MAEDKKAEEAKDAKKQEAEAPEEQPSAPKELKHKRLKITHMTLDQVEKALEKAQQHMGSYNNSAYARALVARKAVLSSTPATQLKKAA